MLKKDAASGEVAWRRGGSEPDPRAGEDGEGWEVQRIRNRLGERSEGALNHFHFVTEVLACHRVDDCLAVAKATGVESELT